jgi:hypothetical protein
MLVPLGLLAGAVLGAVARGWMRLVSDDPEFTWGGTIFIVMAFTLTGLGHGVAGAARCSHRRRWSTTGRVVGAILTLPLFGGAGAIMLPTVLFGAVARWRTDWPTAARSVLAALALAAPTFLAVDIVRSELSAERLAGVVLFVATYWIVISAARAIAAPIEDGWRIRRGHKVALAIAVALPIGLVALSIAGVQG